MSLRPASSGCACEHASPRRLQKKSHTRAMDDTRRVAPAHGAAGREIVLRRTKGRCFWPSLSGDDEVGEVGASAS